MKDMDTNDLTYQIIGAAYEVSKNLGRFLYEEAYEEALQCELKLRGISSERQVYLPVMYKGIKLEKSYRMDLVVENQICVELKAMENMSGKEVRQILSYLSFSSFKKGLLINFGAEDFSVGHFSGNNILAKGIYRFVK